MKTYVHLWPSWLIVSPSFFFFLTRNGVKRVSIVGMVARTYQKYLGLHTVSNSLPFQTCPINETVVGLVAVGFYLCLVGLGSRVRWKQLWAFRSVDLTN